ncbi:MAG TPA: EAL domain-containing protein [Burkholderiales bacterium]|nr:EAL domain-containing protein [Burkholderiales bacterium]
MSEKPEANPADLTDPGLAGWSRPAERLRQAFEKDEFSLYCQPIRALDPASEPAYPLGEVLVRMREEEQAMLPPGEFLPILEHYRMMPELDRWVVRHLARRLVAGARLPAFALNVSAQTLTDPEFPRYVTGIASANGLRRGSLVFEVEEHELLSRPGVVAAFVGALRDSGTAVLVAGFGRKAVSFTSLKALGATYVKVDGSVVRKLMQSELARTKVGAIVRVARAIGMRVIAECVEEPEVLQKLRELGVDYAQGFGIIQPQPIDEMTL